MTNKSGLGDFSSCSVRTVDASPKEQSFSFCLTCPAPKVIETHFKIISAIYPLAMFCIKCLNFTQILVCFAHLRLKLLEHLLFECHIPSVFGPTSITVLTVLAFKFDNIPSFMYLDIIYFMDISDVVNLIIILGKYHIHTCKWKGNTPSFTAFILCFLL